jgi:hypothetical protein
MPAPRLRPLALAATLACLMAAARADGQTAEMRSVDTGLGFTVSVPATWIVGKPSGRNRFVVGSADEDFTLVVTDFGPVPSDAAEAEKVYWSGFEAFGLTLVTTADAVVAGLPAKRYVFTMKADAGNGHVEVVMLPVQGTAYGLMIATPAASADARRAVIAKMFESVSVAGSW